MQGQMRNNCIQKKGKGEEEMVRICRRNELGWRNQFYPWAKPSRLQKYFYVFCYPVLCVWVGGCVVCLFLWGGGGGGDF